MGAASRLRLIVVSGGMLAALLTACTGAGPPTAAPSPTDQTTAQSATDGPTLQPDNLVDLTVYLRAREGGAAYLVPVTREVVVTQDLPRRALELLLAGPQEDEAHLSAPLPLTTQLRELRVEAGTAHVALSPEAVREARTVGDSATDEALALGAIANTLTEFPSIEQVRLEVAGQGITPGSFWGSWGLPGVLVRDDSLIGPEPEDGEGVLDITRFSVERQTVGSSEASGLEITSVRARDRLTYVRLIVEVSHPETPSADSRLPRARVRSAPGEIVLDVAGISRYSAEFAAGGDLGLSDPAFRSLLVDEREGGVVLRLRVDDADRHPFWLHALSGPSRIVLDVRK